ncbi:MAG TPA: alpha/beta hydrolase [Mycobacteriales bacterium]|jgi:pimeloyl-ACP methyl ester carboxylesterase
MADDSPSGSTATHTFATTPAGTAFFAAYDAVLGQWPVAVESRDVPSPYGSTHVQIAGPADGVPLVLLSGAGSTSTVWFGNVADLTRRHRVYAVDTIGDAGRSMHDGRPIRRLADLMDWLDGLFDGLGLAHADLCGHSYGGYLALNYVLHAPHHIGRLALLDPNQCFAGTSLRYLLRAVPLLVRPTAARERSFVEWETGGLPVDPAWLRLASLGAADFPKSKVVMARRPAAGRLRDCTVPTLVLLAGRSRTHDVGKVAANAVRLLPDVVTDTLPAASHHSLPEVDAAPLNRVLVDFLGG